MRPSRQTPSSFSQRVQRHSELWVVGLVFAAPDQLVWGQLFPAEQTRIVQLLVRRVTVTSEGLVIDVRTDGVSGVMRDMMAPLKKVAAE